ncbi:PD40 domain-containing protein [bacterium]|nr:PD40 domain-containing protein [bacterium]
MIDKTISHYRILEELGRGGMGIIYKAEDTKLKRIVALKFLPPELTRDPEAKERFVQEAQAASAFDHPNICNIHEIDETADGQLFIAMASYEGESLKKKIERGPLTLEESVDIAMQVTNGLTKAHERGIVHRDVKPANIFITRDNMIKILDFGLAKLRGQTKLTKAGTTLGTASYMSPQQARGQEVDHRTDIWSLGVVLYEMLTGHLPFHGEYEAAIVYSIVNEEPESAQKYRPNISSELLHILNRSLEKNPEERYQNVHDIVIDLKRVKKEIVHVSHRALIQSDLEPQPVPSRGEKIDPVTKCRVKKIVTDKTRRIKKIRFVFLAGLLFIAILIVMFLLKPFSKEPLPPMKIGPFASSPGKEVTPSLSPDGNQIAYSCGSVGQNDYHIYVKMIGTLTSLKLTTKAAEQYYPSWSPDGRMVAFMRFAGEESGIYKVPALGGAEQRVITIDSVNTGAGLDWSPDGGFIIYSKRDSANIPFSIHTLSVSNMEKCQITFPSNEEQGDEEPTVAPDGRWIAFRRTFSYAFDAIIIVPFNGGSEKRITFDAQIIRDLDWSQDGDEIIFSSNSGGTYGLWRVPFKGGEQKSIAMGADNVYDISVSNRGQRLAYTKTSGGAFIWKGDLPNKEGQIVTTSKLITPSQHSGFGRFSPDGQKIAFMSLAASGNYEIFVCKNDGTNLIQLTNFGCHSGVPVWSPDNKYLAFDSRPQGHSDILITNAEGGQVRYITTEASDDRIPAWSRDGNWIYFTSNRSGSYGIWKLPVVGGKAIQVLPEQGWWISESYDGKWLFYKNQFDDIWKLSLENGEKQPVLHDIFGPNWFPVKDGIFYIEESSDSSESNLLFFSFASNDTKKIAILKQKGIQCLDISSDRGSFLISGGEKGESDIYLVENFH